MKFSISATAIAAMLSGAFAQVADFDPVTSPKDWEITKTGQDLRIEWTASKDYMDGTVKIDLIGGASQPLQVYKQTIATGVPNSANGYTWKIPAELGDDAVNGLMIIWEADSKVFQYSFPFTIKKGDEPVSSQSTTSEASHSYTATDSASVTIVTLTTDQGTKTVHLSDCDTTTAPPAPPAPSTFITSWSTTHAWNNTAVQPPPSPPSVQEPAPTEPAPVPQPPVPQPPAPQPSAPQPPAPQPPVPQPPVPEVPTVPGNTTIPPPSQPTAGAARYVAGPVAIVGGIAMALLAF